MKYHKILKINGREYEVLLKPNWTLLEMLRNILKLTGTKYGCGTGECGACTVLIDGKAMLSCLTLAVAVEGKDIVTIEGLSDKDNLDPIQEKFIETGAFQCGFCTPGFVMTTKALLDENSCSTEKDIRDYFVGNLCRCTGYAKYLDAVYELAKKK